MESSIYCNHLVLACSENLLVMLCHQIQPECDRRPFYYLWLSLVAFGTVCYELIRLEVFKLVASRLLLSGYHCLICTSRVLPSSVYLAIFLIAQMSPHFQRILKILRLIVSRYQNRRFRLYNTTPYHI